MGPEDISALILQAMQGGVVDETTIAAALPGGGPLLQAYLGGRRWPAGGEEEPLAQALGVDVGQVVAAVARMRRRALWSGTFTTADIDAREQERALLAEHIGAILDANALVAADPALAACAPRPAYVSCTLLGGVNVPLGVLLATWQQGRWRGECDTCGTRAYAVSSVGSPLSGTNSTRGVCRACRRFVALQTDHGFMADTVDVLLRTRAWLQPHRQAWIHGRVSDPWPDTAPNLHKVLNDLRLLGPSAGW